MEIEEGLVALSTLLSDCNTSCACVIVDSVEEDCFCTSAVPGGEEGGGVVGVSTAPSVQLRRFIVSRHRHCILCCRR